MAIKVKPVKIGFKIYCLTFILVHNLLPNNKLIIFVLIVCHILTSKYKFECIFVSYSDSNRYVPNAPFIKLS